MRSCTQNSFKSVWFIMRNSKRPFFPCGFFTRTSKSSSDEIPYRAASKNNIRYNTRNSISQCAYFFTASGVISKTQFDNYCIIIRFGMLRKMFVSYSDNLVIMLTNMIALYIVASMNSFTWFQHTKMVRWFFVSLLFFIFFHSA